MRMLVDSDDMDNVEVNLKLQGYTISGGKVYKKAYDPVSRTTTALGRVVGTRRRDSNGQYAIDISDDSLEPGFSF